MSSANSPCAACKLQRRKCTQDCEFAPYFPPDQPQRFANVHQVFGASNVRKLLSELDPSQREEAVHSLAYEAEMRLRDPIYGCVGLISVLQQTLKQLQFNLSHAKSELAAMVGPEAMIQMLQSPYVRAQFHPTIVDQHGGQLVIMDAAQQQPQLIMGDATTHLQAHQVNNVTAIDDQQYSRAMHPREEMEMIRNFEQLQTQPQPNHHHQQQQQLPGFVGGYEVAMENGGGGGGGSGQMGSPAAPFLALGSGFDGNSYDHQQQMQMGERRLFEGESGQGNGELHAASSSC